MSVNGVSPSWAYTINSLIPFPVIEIGYKNYKYDTTHWAIITEVSELDFVNKNESRAR